MDKSMDIGPRTDCVTVMVLDSSKITGTTYRGKARFLRISKVPKRRNNEGFKATNSGFSGLRDFSEELLVYDGRIMATYTGVSFVSAARMFCAEHYMIPRCVVKVFNQGVRQGDIQVRIIDPGKRVRLKKKNSTGDKFTVCWLQNVRIQVRVGTFVFEFDDLSFLSFGRELTSLGLSKKTKRLLLDVFATEFKTERKLFFDTLAMAMTKSIQDRRRPFGAIRFKMQKVFPLFPYSVV